MSFGREEAEADPVAEVQGCGCDHEPAPDGASDSESDGVFEPFRVMGFRPNGWTP